MKRPRNHPPSEGMPGHGYAPFFAPEYRRMFLFGCAILGALVLLITCGLYFYHSAATFVDIRARAAWAETALKAQGEHHQFEEALKNHEVRLEKLEAQGRLVGETLAEIKTTLGLVAADVKDLKSRRH